MHREDYMHLQMPFFFFFPQVAGVIMKQDFLKADFIGIKTVLSFSCTADVGKTGFALIAAHKSQEDDGIAFLLCLLPKL